MTDSMDDAERIAALLDGRLNEGQRAEVLAQLGTSDAAVEVFADAAAIMRETASTGGARHFWRRPGALALAAGILVAVLVPLLWLRMTRTEENSPLRFAALLTDRELPPAWNAAPWSVARGAVELPPRARAARLGARLTDLTVALNAGDTSAFLIAVDVATLIRGIPGSAPIAAAFDSIGRQDVTASRRDSLMARGVPAATAIAGREAVDLGACAEAARLAAARHDTTFFRSGPVRATLRAIVPGDVRPPFHWDEMERDVSSALGSLGS
jgi:hypothetical protein